MKTVGNSRTGDATSKSNENAIRAGNDTHRVVLFSDHTGIDMRKFLLKPLQDTGWQCIDVGPHDSESVEYPLFGKAAAEKVPTGECGFGVIICGSGQGIMMAANKITGVRCGVCSDVVSARLIRAHNDANMLSLGARLITTEHAWEIVYAFVSTHFEGGRHLTRVNMIEGLASGQK